LTTTAQNKVIFGYPRSGTKLLADIFQRQGYHNFGEFFATSTKVVEAEIPYAVRKSVIEQQQRAVLKIKRGPHCDNIVLVDDVRTRLYKFNNFKNITPSIVTVWIDNLHCVPEIFESLNDRHFLCTRRSNEFEQLLSRAVVYSQFNYDGEALSNPIMVNLTTFDHFYYHLYRTMKTQDYLVSCGRGTIIDFNELITGSADLGISYSVTSEDQHTNITDLILNLDAVTKRYQYLKENYDY
jgi:hypothetical protein